MSSNLCPCASKQDYSQCCEPFITGKKEPKTSLELMRSRYTAFAKKAMDYIWKTTDPATLPEIDKKSNEGWARRNKFVGLEILNHQDSGDQGNVEFVAKYTDILGGPVVKHHEKATFTRKEGRWYFTNGAEI
jgi:SEC-C motif domain protein